jgi:hypothetical protein
MLEPSIGTVLTNNQSLFNIGVISRPGAARPRAELDGVTPVPPFLLSTGRQNQLCASPTMTASSARGRAAPGYGKTSLFLQAPHENVNFLALSAALREKAMFDVKPVSGGDEICRVRVTTQ